MVKNNWHMHVCERKSEQAAVKLRKLLRSTGTIQRRGRKREPLNINNKLTSNSKRFSGSLERRSSTAGPPEGGGPLPLLFSSFIGSSASSFLDFAAFFVAAFFRGILGRSITYTEGEQKKKLRLVVAGCARSQMQWRCRMWYM